MPPTNFNDSLPESSIFNVEGVIIQQEPTNRERHN
jgi:hypothetical protein